MAKPKSKKKRNIIIVIILLILVGAGVTIGIIHNANKDTALEDITYTVVSDTFENIIEVSGIVEAAESQTLQIAGEGTVEAVYVKEGDFVTEDTVILELTNAEQEYSLAQLDFNLEQKRINGSTKEVELMEKQREMVLDQLEDRQVIARFDGIVAHLDVAEGDVFEAKDSIGTLINRSYLKATIEVAETDASRLILGQKVNMTFPAYKNETIYGDVTSWPSVARISNSGSSVVDVEVLISDPPSGIIPNYTFFGNIQISEPETFLFVEYSAIGEEEVQEQGGSEEESEEPAEVQKQSFVEIIQEDGSIVKQDVTVEPYDAIYAKIIEGLKEGDVLKAQENSMSGSAVRGPGSSSVQGARLR